MPTGTPREALESACGYDADAGLLPVGFDALFEARIDGDAVIFAYTMPADYLPQGATGQEWYRCAYGIVRLLGYTLGLRHIGADDDIAREFMGLPALSWSFDIDTLRIEVRYA